MFSFDPSFLMFVFVLGPLIGFLSYMTLTSSNYDTLPYRRELMGLPGYAYLYSRSEGDTDLPDRSVSRTLVWLVILYICVIAVLAPFVNKILGALIWTFSVTFLQALLVLAFDACVCALGYAVFATAKSVFTVGGRRGRFLPLAAGALIFAVVLASGMAVDVRLVVLAACFKTVLRLFCFLFFGALAFGINDAIENTGNDSILGRMFWLFLILASVGSLVSIVS